MKKNILTMFAILGAMILIGVFYTPLPAQTSQPPISSQSQTCIGCHTNVTPGIVADWQASRHAQTTVGDALKATGAAKRISSDNIPDNLKGYAVGCAECHTLNAAAHKDNFAHMGNQVNVVVSSNDCKTCHGLEVAQYAPSKKAHAYGNLTSNAVYSALVDTVLAGKEVKDGKLVSLKATDAAKADACLACHGTVIAVNGLKKVTTKIGEQQFPDLSGWPNLGVGRVNPDGSLGACTPCHPRHSFSIEVARKPYSCGQCHLKPDVPAYDVYEASAHAIIANAKTKEFNWTAVPWKSGTDFTAPTCAACHNALIADPQGQVIVQRTHDFGSRLWVRLFGLIYSHPQPKSGDTSILKNKDGLPLPAAFTGELATAGLIDKQEQDTRRAEMGKVCSACHSTNWASNHFIKIDAANVETDLMTLASTQLILKAWSNGLADNKNPFDESIEQKWIRQWLFYSNSIRYSSAMSGQDYAAFENGWWNLNETLQDMQGWIDLRSKK
ncbi:MAG: hydroxylamine oxidase [Chloroflexi bacterium]|nr:hydroxylamine oxidase [Chloroflexota bacterium]